MSIVGIDIGNENTSVGVYANGTFTVICGDDEKNTTPSYVAYTGNEWLVGTAAKKQMRKNYRNTVYDFPSLLGKRFADLSAAQMEHWLFDYAERDGDLVIIFEINGLKQIFSPEYVLTHLLKRIKVNIANQLGKSVTEVVISVPCHLNLRSRLALNNAAWSAGFTVRNLVNKPVAAAIVGCPTLLLKERGNLLVVDVGARRIEVTIFAVNKGILKQKTHLSSYPEGGWICDDRLAKTFLIPLVKKEKVKADDEIPALICLHHASDSLKRKLGNSKKAKVQVDGLLAPGKRTTFSLSRKRFDKHNVKLFSELETCINSTLVAVGFTRMDIDCTVLAGGGSKILQVQTLLHKLFGEDRILMNFEPEHTVSYGAAALGAMLADKKGVFPFAREYSNRTSRIEENNTELLLTLKNVTAASTSKDAGIYQSETLDYFRMLRTIADEVHCANQETVAEMHTRFKMKCDQVIQILQNNRLGNIKDLHEIRQQISEDWANFTCRLLKLLVSSSAIGARDQDTRITRRQEVTNFAISIRQKLDCVSSIDTAIDKEVLAVKSMCDNILQYIGHNELLDFDRLTFMRQMLEQKWNHLNMELQANAMGGNGANTRGNSDDMVISLPGDDSDSDSGSCSRRSKADSRTEQR